MIRCPILPGLQYFCGFIHPFYDGNGRFDRYMSSYYLIHDNSSVSGYAGSIGLLKPMERLLSGLKITNDIRNRGDLTYFVILFLDILKGQMKDMLDTGKEYA